MCSSDWAKVDKAVRGVGTWSSVVFDDGLIHKVLQDMGGWLAVGMKQSDEWPFVAKEFETRYRGYKQRNESVEHLPVMIGRAESENFVNGYHKSDNPVLIGNHEQAMAVLANGNKKSNLQFKSLSETLSLPNKNTGEVTA